jgi:hypothetical protein
LQTIRALASTFKTHNKFSVLLLGNCLFVEINFCLN